MSKTDILWSSWQKAARDYDCDACGEQICAGEYYSRSVMRTGSRLTVFRSHGTCPPDPDDEERRDKIEEHEDRSEEHREAA